MSNSVYTAPTEAPQEPTNGHRARPDRQPPVGVHPLPRLGDLRRLTLDELYAASQDLADWCCRGYRANADMVADPCEGCPRVGAVRVAYDAVVVETETRPEHRRAVARLVRQMRARS